MSINELATPASNLTPEQRRQQEAAILGIPAPDAASAGTLTYEQIEFMRTQVAQFDQRNQPREFDLNNPPRKPYYWQEFPKMLYHHEDRVAKVVQNRAQEEAMVALGYVREPFLAEAAAPAVQLDPATLAEVARLDAEARKKKAGK